MPVSRWWEFENGTVHFGDLEAGPADLARLLVAEFATVYADDHFVVPGPRADVSRSRKVPYSGQYSKSSNARSSAIDILPRRSIQAIVTGSAILAPCLT
jgi:hypothetical protein